MRNDKIMYSGVIFLDSLVNYPDFNDYENWPLDCYITHKECAPT